MAVKGNILYTVLKSSSRLGSKKEQSPAVQQRRALTRLLRRAKDTSFGKVYRFNKILQSDNPVESFQKYIPISDYNSMYEKWWFRTLSGEEDVSWPGKINKFALSSGTSGAPSKHIPVSRSQMRKIRRASLKQLTNLNKYTFDKEFYDTFILGVGGCTKLTKVDGRKEGDLSGIIAANFPNWFNPLYKPEKEISGICDWDEKIEQMVEAAPNWNIGIIAGIPSWIQILLEKIIERYNLNSIHDLWPHFSLLVHGGVAFGPYKENFSKLLGRPIEYMETYLASEGFMAINRGTDTPLELLLNNGIFFEFVPFNDDNFTSDGQLVEFPEVLTIDQIKEGENYALLLSTCSGAWRYMIGDTIKFLDVAKAQIVITGRTKHYLSLCGEHLSVDNMNKGIEMVCKELNLTIPEYTVHGFAYENLFAHKWHIGIKDGEASAEEIKLVLDKALCKLNDDYAVERTSALKEIFIEIVPVETFYQFLSFRGKKGAQIKFPKVMGNDLFEQWEGFLKNN